MKDYYQLTKPGIIYGNSVGAVAGFFLASRGQTDWGLFFAMFVGLALIIASACATNNYLDIDIDARMERTKVRALPLGRVQPLHALVFAGAVGILGATILFFFTNLLTLGVALAGWLVYVGVYTPAKRVTPHALFIGAIAGAVPPVVGYVAVVNTLDLSALILFAFLFLWQIPHFLAIAVFRYEEYATANIPLFVKNPPSEKERESAKKVFYATLVVLLLWCITLMLQR